MFQPSPLRGLPAKTPRLFSSRSDQDRLVHLFGSLSLGLRQPADRSQAHFLQDRCLSPMPPLLHRHRPLISGSSRCEHAVIFAHTT